MLVGRCRVLTALAAVLALAACAPFAGQAPAATSGPTASGFASRPAGEAAGVAAAPTPLTTSCEPTRPDALGPFYKPNAPLRTSVGSGYVLAGTVRAAGNCRPIPVTQIELWLANPRGEYDDARRATMRAGPNGEYQFESHVPVPYAGRPPHIHVRVTAPGHQTLVTQHYPQRGQTAATFDLVLVPTASG